ncbi:hypothetical protein VNO80_19499 [Phaseolus coccineus]|uniref:Uncharacterized protein n=1 Tax=Phaseolus coccineus TaxID=3886 RepID=A0AAN9ML18_PHACN
MFANLLYAIQFHYVHEEVLLCEKVLHEISEAKPRLVVGVTIGIEKERVVLEKVGDLAAAWEFELSMELADVIEADDVLRLGEEELLGCVTKRRRALELRMHSREGMRLDLGLGPLVDLG